VYKLLALTDSKHKALIVFGHDGSQWSTLKLLLDYYDQELRLLRGGRSCYEIWYWAAPELDNEFSKYSCGPWPSPSPLFFVIEKKKRWTEEGGANERQGIEQASVWPVSVILTKRYDVPYNCKICACAVPQ
jgi:hypothetical protein